MGWLILERIAYNEYAHQNFNLSLNEHLELTEERFFKECSQHWPDFVPDSAKSMHNHIAYNFCMEILLQVCSP